MPQPGRDDRRLARTLALTRLWTVLRFLFRMLFDFPSRCLFAISWATCVKPWMGRFTRKALGCVLKRPDSWDDEQTDGRLWSCTMRARHPRWAASIWESFSALFTPGVVDTPSSHTPQLDDRSVSALSHIDLGSLAVTQRNLVGLFALVRRVFSSDFRSVILGLFDLFSLVTHSLYYLVNTPSEPRAFVRGFRASNTGTGLVQRQQPRCCFHCKVFVSGP